MVEYRNIVLAIIISIVILFGFDIYYGTRYVSPADISQQVKADQQAKPDTPPQATANNPTLPTPAQNLTQSQTKAANAPPVPGAITAQVPGKSLQKSREDLLAVSERVLIKSPRLDGSISLTGARIDDLKLADYHAEIDPSSPEIIMFSPRGLASAYYADFGWVAAPGVVLPGPDTLWQADRKILTADNPVTLTWDNGHGLIFKRTFAVDENFMFTVTQRIKNTSNSSVSVFPYNLISRRGTPKVTGYIILHEGLIGVLDGTLSEVKYKDIQESGTIKQTTTGGWLGITDKYWLAALVPDQKAKVNTRFYNYMDADTNLYQTDFVGQQLTVAPGATIKAVNGLFVGAKEAKLLDNYATDQGITRFDLAIDFGHLYFLTKPIFYSLIFIKDFVGNFGVSILLLTVAIKLMFFPLANKSYVSMSKMKKLQPKMKLLKERFGDDKQRMNQELMALYKREKVNPAAGCLPVIIQIPVFFSLYKVLFVTIEMRHAPFFGWIHDLSVPDPTSVFNLFGILPFDPPSMLMIGVWPLIMGISMFLQQKLNPQPTDAIQAKVFMFLPIIFTFMLSRFPAGLVIYWAWNNSLSILQQWLIMRRMGVKV